MKMIIAIIRNECLEPLKNALEILKIHDGIVILVIDKGSQKGTIRATDPEVTLRHESGIHKVQLRRFLSETESPAYLEPEIESEEEFFQKSMFIIVTIDENIHSIVQTFISINQSGRYGDGKIFICPMATAIEVQKR